ncbi:glycosyltransferase family 1 protein [candidate division KSB1 bacterium]|nr:glycosyltransferase family 1 protein [candidate division KSB1 bacterium]
MRIAYFTESLPPSTDGVARTLVNLADSLIANHIDFRFFSPFKPEHDLAWTDRVVKVSSIPFILYPQYRVSMPMLRKINRLLDEFKPDLVHSTAPTLIGTAGLNCALKHNIPAVSSYHTHFAAYFKYYGFRLFENAGWNYLKWFYNRFRRIYAPSRSSVSELELKGFENVELWERGIDIGKFSPKFRNPARLEKMNGENQPVLLFVGRLVKEKDLDDLISADLILRAKGLSFKLVIVGDGPMMPTLKEQLPEAEFTGFLYGKALSEKYASADIFVFPSTTETFGNVILEAFASGLPAVGVDRGGVADLIQNGQTGFLAKAKQPKDFASKIGILLKNKDIRQKMSATAQAFAKNYSWEAINNRLINSYHHTICTYHRTEANQ